MEAARAMGAAGWLAGAAELGRPPGAAGESCGAAAVGWESLPAVLTVQAPSAGAPELHPTSPCTWKEHYGQGCFGMMNANMDVGTINQRAMGSLMSCRFDHGQAPR